MRAVLMAVALMAGSCASANAQVLDVPNSLWRTHTEHLVSDRAAVHACLVAGEGGCESLIQTACLRAYDEDSRVPALARQCDWRAIAAWEDEILAMLARLRSKLGGDNLRNLNDSEAAWERSMLADVGLGMDYYAGGSISGPIGAHIRARAAAQRAVYLYEIQQMVNE
jgi:hypothetical protein